MFERIFGYWGIQKKIEYKLIQLSFIPCKYFEALYVECGTQIPCQTLDICEMEEKQIRSDLLKLMKEGEVDTKVELEKFYLFERLNAVYNRAKEIRELMNQYVDKMEKGNYNRLINILEKVSKSGRIMFHAVKALYDNYEMAIKTTEELKQSCEKIVEGLYEFKYANEKGEIKYSFEDPEVLIGNSLRTGLTEMIAVGEKINDIIEIFSFNHKKMGDERNKEETEQKKLKPNKKKKNEKFNK